MHDVIRMPDAAIGRNSGLSQSRVHKDEQFEGFDEVFVGRKRGQSARPPSVGVDPVQNFKRFAVLRRFLQSAESQDVGVARLKSYLAKSQPVVQW